MIKYQFINTQEIKSPDELITALNILGEDGWFYAFHYEDGIVLQRVATPDEIPEVSDETEEEFSCKICDDFTVMVKGSSNGSEADSGYCNRNNWTTASTGICNTAKEEWVNTSGKRN